MGKPASSQGKGQKSISSFFTPKPTINGIAQARASQAAQNPPPTRKESSSNIYDAESDDEDIRAAKAASLKRALTEDSNGGNSGVVDRPMKRAKGDDSDGSAYFADAPKSKSPATKAKISPRTEKYLYTASQPAAESLIAEEEENPSDKARKEELHKKWMKKIAGQQIGRRWQTNDDSTLIEVGEGEAEEDEETPPPVKTKKKGAKTGKLTPLELQILDIKRKHMDTLLIIEVGYKFKFFGEDARTAAKELSIVCIPGKFRYDERMSCSTSAVLKPC
jgi:DNA mismatch repair protein MSH3